MDENTTEQSSEFVDSLANMSPEEVSANFYDLMSGILEIYPEDTK